jgi:hypothetical protein
MFLASNTSETVLRGRIDGLGMASDYLALLSGVPASRLSQAWRGIKPLDAATAERLLALTASLEALQKALWPIPLALSGNPVPVRNLLDTIRQNDIQLETISATIKDLFQQ